MGDGRIRHGIMNATSTQLVDRSTAWILGGWAIFVLLVTPGMGMATELLFQIQRTNGTTAIAIRGAPGQRVAIESKPVLDAREPGGWVVIDRLILNDQGSHSLERPAHTASEFFRMVPEINRYWTNMAIIPAGEFRMGSADWGPIHAVMVSEFAMDCYEVTKLHWDEVRTWAATNGYSLPSGRGFGNSTHPVHSVGWYDMLKWCNARSEKEGLKPAYYTDLTFSKVYKSGSIVPYVDWSSGYRLPTESEWEKAARGGNPEARFPWGIGPEIDPSRANYADSGLGGTTPVGSYAPNPYGLFDLAGNLEERCWDALGPYPAERQVDPRGPGIGLNRAIRGGHWNSSAISCRIDDRGDLYPDNWGSAFRGFRCVRAVVR
jgi:formylglycine-generating enzyme required for sulfatase activity